jgi:hypothetical protein
MLAAVVTSTSSLLSLMAFVGMIFIFALTVAAALLLSAPVFAAASTATTSPHAEAHFLAALGAPLRFGEAFFGKEALFADVKNELAFAILAREHAIAWLKRRRFRG